MQGPAPGNFTRCWGVGCGPERTAYKRFRSRPGIPTPDTATTTTYVPPIPTAGPLRPLNA